MTPAGPQRDLGALLRGRVPIVVVETRDEQRARQLVVSQAPGAVFEWMVSAGLRRADIDLGPAQRFNADPTAVLATIQEGMAGTYVLIDYHHYLDDPVHVRLLKDIAQGYARVPRTVVLISQRIDLPADLEPYVARFQLAFLSRAERRAVVDEVARDWVARNGRLVTADEGAIEALVDNLSGLAEADVRRLAVGAIIDDGAIRASDVPAVQRAKYELLSRGGVLTFELDTAGLADLAGMDQLKVWLERRRPAFDGRAPGLDPPKGLLLLGVQGCGKSLAAKVAAGIFGVPLLRLDLGAVHDKYVGESERRMRESLATADVMAPCVLWIDEIEKGIATSDSDSGTSTRLLGTFLTWLAEKDTPVFVVATANDISRLPPELVRKGRFDEVFFVDLPTPPVRAAIAQVHADRRKVALPEGGAEAVAAATEGYSGAEIEQAVSAAEYAALAAGRPVTLEDVLAEVRATRPLSVVMAEQVVALRAWARTRTVPAG